MVNINPQKIATFVLIVTLLNLIFLKKLIISLNLRMKEIVHRENRTKKVLTKLKFRLKTKATRKTVNVKKPIPKRNEIDNLSGKPTFIPRIIVISKPRKNIKINKGTSSIFIS
jgi:hypothetical protein